MTAFRDYFVEPTKKMNTEPDKFKLRLDLIPHWIFYKEIKHKFQVKKHSWMKTGAAKPFTGKEVF